MFTVTLRPGQKHGVLFSIAADGAARTICVKGVSSSLAILKRQGSPDLQAPIAANGCFSITSSITSKNGCVECYVANSTFDFLVGEAYLPINARAADAALLGGKPPEYYAGPVNLLDNAYFAVAQAGYGGMHGNKLYAADRWQYNGQAGQVVMGDGLIFSEAFVIYQAIEGVNLADGQTRTLGVCTAEGEIGTCILQAGYTALGNTGYSGTYDTGYACYIMRNGASAGIKWAAIYEGSYTADTFPTPVLRPYSVELTECQRYYRTIGALDVTIDDIVGTGVFSNGELAEIYIPLGVIMRVTPSVEVIANGYLYGAGIYLPVTGIALARVQSHGVVLVCQAAVTSAHWFRGCVLAGGACLELSADL